MQHSEIILLQPLINRSRTKAQLIQRELKNSRRFDPPAPRACVAYKMDQDLYSIYSMLNIDQNFSCFCREI